MSVYLRSTSTAPRRRRAWRRWLRRALFAGIVASLPLAFVAWVLGSSAFALQGWTLLGSERVEEGWIEARLEPWRDRQLLLLDLRAVEETLLEHPWAAAVAVEKHLPHRLRIEISDRVAVAILHEGGQTFLVDIEGRLIAPDDGSRAGLLRLDHRAGDPSQPADRRTAIELTSWLRGQSWVWSRGGIERVDLYGSGGLELHLQSLDVAILVPEQAARDRLMLLERLLPAIRERAWRPQLVDLRVEGRAVVRQESPGLAPDGAEEG